MKHVLVICLLVLFLVACQPQVVTEIVEVTREVQVTKLVEVTRIVEKVNDVEITRLVEIPMTVEVKETVVVAPTATPGPSLTPSKTATPTRTPTAWLAVTCEYMSLNYGDSSTPEQMLAQMKKFDDKCVRLNFIVYPDGSEQVIGYDYVYAFDAVVILDAQTPAHVTKPLEFSKIWGIFELKEGQERPVIHLRRTESVPANQHPKFGEGLFMVGSDRSMDAGEWKSGQLPVKSNDCYWARLNARTGNVRENHQGIGGMMVRLEEGDVFETNRSCAPWYYVRPLAPTPTPTPTSEE